MRARTRIARLLGQRDISVGIGACLFFAGALLSGVTMLMPHSEAANETGFYWLALAEVLIGVAALALPRRALRWAPWLFVVSGVLVVSATLYFNGENSGGPATLSEFYYAWPALYAGYFFGPRAIVALVGFCGAAYAGTLAAIALDPPVAFTRWVVTMSVLAGAAAALHAMRRQNKSLVAALHSTARTDPLTGTLNRRGFAERFALEVERSARTGQPFALLLGDLDNFKDLNDRFGHIAGDEALASVGEALRGASRAIDTAARIGGEEFVLLMPATGGHDGLEAAERLRGSVSMVHSPSGLPLTISFGVVEHPAHGATWTELMGAADHALYTAKTSGRNRSVAYGDEPLAARAVSA
jgi:diguanylate cyclase (GGDEF)-like protein